MIAVVAGWIAVTTLACWKLSTRAFLAYMLISIAIVALVVAGTGGTP